MSFVLWCYRVEVRVVDRIVASETGDELQPYQAWMKVAEFLERHSKMLMVSGGPDDYNDHRQKLEMSITATVSHVP